MMHDNLAKFVYSSIFILFNSIDLAEYNGSFNFNMKEGEGEIVYPDNQKYIGQ